MTVSIVIPAHNEEATIAACLDACLDQTSPPTEIIVVSNMSTDRTTALVASYQASHPHIGLRLIIQDEHLGIAPTRNAGFDCARGDVIARIDADSKVDPDWVEAIQRCFRDPQIAAATGPVRYYDMPLQQWVLKVDDATRRLLHRLASDHRILFGTNMAIRSTAWRQVRAMTHLDLANALHEDIDLAMTLFSNRLHIAYEPSMVVGMSARRLDSSPGEFYRYCMRYHSTIRAHQVTSRVARIPIYLFLVIYLPGRAIRLVYGRRGRLALAALRRGRRR